MAIIIPIIIASSIGISGMTILVIIICNDATIIGGIIATIVISVVANVSVTTVRRASIIISIVAVINTIGN